MIIFFIVNFHFGIETGVNQPVAGLEYTLNSGIVFTGFVGKKILNNNFYLNLAFNSSYYYGNNPGYSFSTYGMDLFVKKSNWRITPLIGMGFDYALRQLEKNKEWGMGFDYEFGILTNFYYENLNIYPAIYYDGITDFKAHTGSLGIKLGIGYEFQ